MNETYIVPVTNEMGWRVRSPSDYNQLMHHIIYATVELQQEYPDKQILVTYLTGEEGA